VASAFVSYAHEDREFVLARVERLQKQDLEIRYDGVALEIGDSLIQVISREIYCADDARSAFAGLFRADDGTRTHDLLHGNPPRHVHIGPAAAWLSQIAE
jgi:hypothetical protein